MQVERINPHDDHQWLKQALNNTYKLQRVAPPIIEVLFQEVIFGEPNSQATDADCAKDP